MQENKKIQILPMETWLILCLLFVNKIVCFIFRFALLNYNLFVSLQIVRNYLFNIGFGRFATLLKPTKGARLRPFLISKNLHLSTIY